MADSMTHRINGEPNAKWTYLFHDHGNDIATKEVYTIDRHAHPFWQIDFFCAGRVALQVPVIEDLFPGDCLITPAGVVHSLHYPELGTQWVSVKCSVEGYDSVRRISILRSEPLLSHISSAVRSILQSHDAPPRRHRDVLPPLFLALLEYAFSTETTPDEGFSASVRTIIEFVSSHRYESPTVHDAAAKSGYSIGHASNKFRSETGMSIKTFIDKQRAEDARRLLQFSDAAITTVALRLGFPDVYSFSRFFHRKFGQGPRAYRTSHRSG